MQDVALRRWKQIGSEPGCITAPLTVKLSLKTAVSQPSQGFPVWSLEIWEYRFWSRKRQEKIRGGGLFWQNLFCFGFSSKTKNPVCFILCCQRVMDLDLVVAMLRVFLWFSVLHVSIPLLQWKMFLDKIAKTTLRAKINSGGRCAVSWPSSLSFCWRDPSFRVLSASHGNVSGCFNGIKH